MPKRRLVLVGLATALAVVGAACATDPEPTASGSGSGSTGTSTVTTGSSGTPVPPPVATAVDITGLEVTPVPTSAVTPIPPTDGDGDPAPSYVETEHLVSGVAATYSGPAVGPALEATTGTAYTTRIVVRLPADPTSFSGRVFVEPFNTSAGADAGVVWASIAPLLQDSGDGWIGVTVRSSSQAALQSADPTRYAALAIPTNDIEWDILRQLGGLVKQGGEPSPIAGDVDHVYLGGFSQSGIDVATFATAMNEITRMQDGSPVYDGYLPAGHSGSLAPLQSGTSALPTFESTPMDAVDSPVLDLETQSDVEGFVAPIDATLTYTSPGGASIRRADADTDDDRYRLYEIAGAPHVPGIPSCDGDGSTFPTATNMRAAAALLFRWAEDGVAPPQAPRIDLAATGTVSAAALDPDGNATGGVPSPFLEVPLGRYEAHSSPGALCALAGRETPFPAADLVSRYGSADGYLERFTSSLDETIDADYLREEDRPELLDLARTRADASFAGSP